MHGGSLTYREGRELQQRRLLSISISMWSRCREEAAATFSTTRTTTILSHRRFKCPHERSTTRRMK